MFRVDTDLLKQINSIGDINIPLPDHYRSRSSQLASMRIVPLVTRGADHPCGTMCAGKKLLDIRPYQNRKVGVIITGSGIPGRIKDKFEPVVRAKPRSTLRDPQRYYL